jgi:hypothetical protein
MKKSKKESPKVALSRKSIKALASIRAYGKAPAKHDHRTIKLEDIQREANVLLAEHPLPEEYDFDDNHQIPTPQFRNPPDLTCVIAGRAHQTLRFELAHQKVLINITDDDVWAEFREETGGRNEPIETLKSLKLWRKRGWEAAGQHFNILAFAKLDPDKHEQIKHMIYINVGVGLGFGMPASANYYDLQPWEVTPDLAGKGHYVYASGYTKHGPVCVTWGRKQQMSWAFVDKYCDEAYVIIDAIDTPEKKQYFDEEKIKKCLESCAPVLGKTDRVSPA